MRYYIYISRPKLRILAAQLPTEGAVNTRSRSTTLKDFFVSAFSSHELRNLLYRIGDRELVDNLEFSNSPISKLAYEAEDALMHRGLVDNRLFELLEEERPGRLVEIRELASLAQRTAADTGLPFRMSIGTSNFRDIHRDWMTSTDVATLHPIVERVVAHLEGSALIGSIDTDRPYIRHTMNLKVDAFRDYAADLAFLGGSDGDTSLALIGSPGSLVGYSEERVDAHRNRSATYYTMRFLGQYEHSVHSQGAPGERGGGSSEFKSAFEIAMALSTPPQKMEFVARVLFREIDESGAQTIVATPIYVSLAD